jgi:hypothetical protein
MLRLSTFEELAEYVHGVLVQKGDLDESTPMIDRMVLSNGEPIGIEYTVLAPRSVRLSAAWSAAEGRILFYDAELTRFQSTAVQGPSADAIAGRPRRTAHAGSLWTGK